MSLIKNSILYLISTILVKATTFFLLPVYSYMVSPEEYGYVYIVAASTQLLMLLMQLSTQVCISRFLFDCKNNDEVKLLYSTVVITAVVFSTLIFVVVWLCGDTIANVINLPLKYFRLACLIPYIGLFYNLILSLLYARQDAKKVSLTSSTIGIINIVIQVILVYEMEDKAMALIISMLVNSIITFLIFLFYSYPYFVFKYDYSRIKSYLYYAISQIPSDLSAWLVSFTDRIVINKYIGPAETGIYGIGSTIGNIPSVVYTSMNQAYVPYAYSNFKLIEKSDNTAHNNIVNTTEILSGIVIMLITLFVIFSNNIVCLFSSSYASSSFIVVVMLIASLFDIFRIIYMQPLCFNVKFTKIKSAIWLFSGIINMGLNFLVIPKYGIYGGCLTSLVTYIVTFFLLLYFSKKAIPLSYRWINVWKVVIISIIMFPLIFLGNSMLVFILKATAYLSYIVLCDKILKLNIKNKIISHVKFFSYKH
ncbi:oligosaccharide flippase family protein [Bacteroides neonati]|uniref:oligosaccharide flippase family protein n=1 Tax=Bacteroides neonati TaxID=1347393 RepID=UPI0004AD8924|nr:oligosaccharide flippase family protein [Bacteroides neonati]